MNDVSWDTAGNLRHHHLLLGLWNYNLGISLLHGHRILYLNHLSYGISHLGLDWLLILRLVLATVWTMFNILIMSLAIASIYDDTNDYY